MASSSKKTVAAVATTAFVSGLVCQRGAEAFLGTPAQQTPPTAPENGPVGSASAATAASSTAGVTSTAGVAVALASAASLYAVSSRRQTTAARTYASVAKSSRPVALRAFESELGAQPPLGFWDPLGLSADGDTAFFKRLFPGYLSPKLGLKFDDVPNGLAAISKVPAVGWQQIVAFLGIYELFINKPVGDMPGNYGKGNLGIG
eukprot:CAMPEP_0178428500 /NCGR_PEP_ID=MMETSP0689_2-20121128/30311_1 /TAXON_ID=160604 /ORGANISM="Amphidinium massartii, Strain CS-259" /LENGTH=203 /DNA_ID=CAMNT_0020050277 /DNA_START=72 /DNA_END=679 /DNA_ORIENTATION=+